MRRGEVFQELPGKGLGHRWESNLGLEIFSHTLVQYNKDNSFFFLFCLFSFFFF